MDYRMRMLPAHRRRLQELLSDNSTEQACFLLTSSAGGDNEVILLVREVIELAREDFLVKAGDQISVSPKAMMRIMRQAQAASCGVCMVHTHPGHSASVGFSRADDLGNVSTFGFYCQMVPDGLHSCLVWNGDLSAVEGRVYHSSDAWDFMSQLEVVGGPAHEVFKNRRQGSAAKVDDPLYDRQVRLLGDRGQRVANSLRVVIVGMGGIGSVAAQTLGHSGTGSLLQVDYDHTKPWNRPRQVGSTDEDVENAVLKTEVMRRYLELSCPRTKVETVNDDVRARELLPRLISADAIVCATDDTSSRAYLNQLSHQYLVPLLDLGVEFSADKETGTIKSDVGKVNLALPGAPCLWCSGHIDSQRLRWESMPPESQQREIRDGYVPNWELPEPSMMMFNGEVANRGAQKLLGYFTGLLAADPETYERFSFLGDSRFKHCAPVRKRHQESCPICSQGGVIAMGDAVPMPFAPSRLGASQASTKQVT